MIFKDRIFQPPRIIAIVLIVTVIAVVYWPALRSFFVVDDYFLIAISRLVEEPFSAFVHNHFPIGTYYRPLSMAFWWLTVEIVGSSPYWHYVINLALHIGVCLALWRLLSRWIQAPILVLVATLVFASHPIAIGTSLWLSDRFDLLAALLGLLAIDAARRFRLEGSGRTLITAFVMATLATLSKETGFAAFVPMAIIWFWPQLVESENVTPAFWNAPRRAAIALAVLSLILLGWRTFLLGGALGPVPLNGISMPQLLFEGIIRWAEVFLTFLMQLPRMGNLARACVCIGVAGLTLRLGLGFARSRFSILKSEGFLLIVAASGLMLATAILQAPTLHSIPLDINPDTLGVWVAANSRFFYDSLIGLAMLVVGLHVLTEASFDRLPLYYRKFDMTLVAVFVSLCLAPWAVTSHQLSRTYRKESRAMSALIVKAEETISRQKLPAERCQVYFLGIDHEQVFLFTITADSAIKVLTPDISLVQNCLFQTEATPWTQIVKRNSVSFASAAPMQAMYLGGRVLPWPQYGGVEIAYLNLLDNIDATTMHSAIFLAYDHGSFIDVTSDVLAGRRPVKFHCMRAKEQCGIDADAPPGTLEP